jgi:hypothetical protein
MCIRTKTSINTYTKQNEWARLQIHRIGAKQTGTTHGRKHCHTTISASKRRILTKVVPNESSWQPAQQYVEFFLVKSSRRETESNKHLKIAYFGRFWEGSLSPHQFLGGRAESFVVGIIP